MINRLLSRVSVAVWTFHQEQVAWLREAMAFLSPRQPPWADTGGGRRRRDAGEVVGVQLSVWRRQLSEEAHLSGASVTPLPKSPCLFLRMDANEGRPLWSCVQRKGRGA